MKTGGNPWRTAWLITAVAAVTLLAQSAFAALTTANKGAKEIAAVSAIVDTSDNSFGTTENIDGATATLTVPAAQTAILIVRLSAGSTCNFGAAGNICFVSFKVDGATNEFSLFDTDDTGDNYAESHSAQFVSRVLNPGPHTVQLTFNANQGSTLRVSRGIMTAELWRVS